MSEYRPNPSFSDSLRGLLYAGGFFFLPFCLLWSKWEAVKGLFLIVVTVVLVDLYEDFIHAETLRARIADLEAEVQEATQRAVEAEDENVLLEKRIGASDKGLTSGTVSVLTTVESLNRLKKRDSGVSFPDTSRSSTEVESSTGEEKQNPEPPRINLELSLSHAHGHISALQCLNEHLNADLDAAKSRMLSLEEGRLQLLRELQHAQSVISSISRAANQLKAGQPQSAPSNDDFEVSKTKSSRKPARTQREHKPSPKHAKPSPPLLSEDATEDAEQFIGSLVAEEAALLCREGLGVRDFAHGKRKKPKRSPSTVTVSSQSSKASIDEESPAALCEMLIRRRVLAKVDMAFRECRKRGTFDWASYGHGHGGGKCVGDSIAIPCGMEGRGRGKSRGRGRHAVLPRAY
ncbi:hypothetical protein P280DRAFT_516356 [Massarina eburnea CBS 473.64]|uniref:Uncharacterized protein n=1 Tax=Massarina eburnea CBS 473.64 TaxID=1395130 RepID=A0A6A6S4U4_9PLEO|nr:hypothetical protein P280DRAFT_516356 [Massarina eburnea CBS 473.64]